MCEGAGGREGGWAGVYPISGLIESAQKSIVRC